MERRNLLMIILYALLGLALVVGVIYLLRNREEILTNRLKVNAPSVTKPDTRLPEGTRPLDSYEHEEPFNEGGETPYISPSRFKNAPSVTPSPQSP